MYRLLSLLGFKKKVFFSILVFTSIFASIMEVLGLGLLIPIVSSLLDKSTTPLASVPAKLWLMILEIACIPSEPSPSKSLLFSGVFLSFLKTNAYQNYH